MMTIRKTRTVDTKRRRRYDAVRRESSIQALQITANEATADAQALIAEGDMIAAAGAATVAVRAMLLRAASPSGLEGVSMARDLEIKRVLILRLEEVGLPIAAIMVAAAVAYEEALVSPPIGSARH